MKKRFKIKYLKSIDRWVLHVKRVTHSHVHSNGGVVPCSRRAWRREWGYTFATESQARTFAEGNF